MPQTSQTIHTSDAQHDSARRDRIREARLSRLRELLELARAEHCFDNETPDHEDDHGRGEVDTLMALATELSLQRRAGIKVTMAQALSGADALQLQLAARSNATAIDEARAALERETEAHRQTAERLGNQVRQEADAHRKTASALTAAQTELAELKRRAQSNS
jgi:C4-dicarboxylate-specific signal transduction histidine kinase